MTDSGTTKANTNTPLLMLVDGSSYLFRAYHAMPEAMANSNGERTGAIYGVVNMMRKLIKDYAPSHIAVVFDAKGKTFRDDIFSEYKANRPPMPDDLRNQIEPLHNIIKAMGLPLIVKEGVEADDVIGTLAAQATTQGIDTIISTGDKDMAQLVNQHVTLINTMNNSTMDEQGVVEKFMVKPEQIIDYLALMGDSSDNIPGVPKVGPKTAAKWLNQFGSLEGIKQHADEIGGKVGESLRNSLKSEDEKPSLLDMSYDLATIKCDVELDYTPTELNPEPPDYATLQSLYSHLEFKTWLAEAHRNGDGETSVDQNTAPDTLAQTAPAPSHSANYVMIDTDTMLDDWLKKLQKADCFAFDTETTSLDYMQAKIVGLSFCVEPGEAAYIPLAHDYADAPTQLDRNEVLAKFKPILEDSQQAKLGQNLKYDKNVLVNHGIELQGIQFDTMLESYILDSTATRHDMDSLALKYLNQQTIHFEDVAGKGKNQLTFNQISVEEATPYAAEDADITFQLHDVLWPKLSAEPELASLYKDIEVPLISVLSRIERNGVLIDTDMLKQQSVQLTERIAQIEKAAHENAGESFNLSSPKQIQAILYDKQGLPVLKKTPKGQPSTAEAVLQDLALDYPLPKLILEYRGLAKLKSTYTDKLPEEVDKNSGRVHTSYHQAVASTGRLSSSDPNLQNIPIRTAEGRRIREAFVAPPGMTMVAADYSQIELRIMAHLSGDEGLLKAFAAGEDIHNATAAEVFGLDSEAVSTEARRRAKAINFGLIYGMSAFGLARQLGIGRKEAQAYVDLYFERYPGVKEFMDKTRQLARDQGYVKTVFGRRLYLPEINHRNAQRRQYAERTAINAPMQGTAADIIKLAMIRADELLRGYDFPIKMIMQVHDELVFEIDESHIEEAVAGIDQTMTSVATLSVPLRVDIGMGKNWHEAH